MRLLIATAVALGLIGFFLMPQPNTSSLLMADDLETQGATSTREKINQPVELGQVKWLRDLDQAVAQAKQSNKPIALLFQEVPG